MLLGKGSEGEELFAGGVEEFGGLKEALLETSKDRLEKRPRVHSRRVDELMSSRSAALCASPKEASLRR
jgi:hypothetical protein